ncbi:MAG: PBP1A family penicillin-binding protein [Candidatus Eisenbacteria bacterium]|nr:PBP1A family penicillin-binding protein [Candidatus Eisenbacteria bacterium]
MGLGTEGRGRPRDPPSRSGPADPIIGTPRRPPEAERPLRGPAATGEGRAPGAPASPHLRGVVLTPIARVWFARAMKRLLIAIVVTPLLMAAGLYALFMFWGSGLPIPSTMEELRPSARSVVYDRNGSPVGNYFVEDRQPIALAEVPQTMIEAVLAAEDRRFYGHWGVNLTAIVRAFARNVRAGEVTQGASTITQQLARNLFLDQSRTLERKIKEIILAIRLERSFSKDEILELYLNRIYFGDGAYGVQAAAHRYFGEDVRDLTVPQAALIAGLPANPTAFSPVRRPERAMGRRNRVLAAMAKRGFIDTNAYQEAIAAPLGILGGASPAGEAPYFLEYVRLQLMERYGAKGVYHGGMGIHTSLDLRLQRAAEKAIDKSTRAIEEDHFYRDRFDSYRESERPGAEEGTPYLQAALVALEPQTGEILAMVGGRAWQDSRFNRAVQARRQPGSAFKPFVYAIALREGARPGDLIVDEPVSYPMGRSAAMGYWTPRNFKNRFEGSMTLRHALAKSINIPSVKLLDRVGPRQVVDFAHRCGIRGEIPAYLSIALGTAEVTPLEMASAYGSFANQGILVSPVSILRVEDRLGRTIEESVPRNVEVLDEKTSASLVSMMRSVIDRGTAGTARSEMEFRAPAAGKTGTTDDYTDAWFIGFTPRCVCAVWVGFDVKRTLGSGMTGAKAALPIWVDFMKEFVRINGEEEFQVPEGMVGVATCERSGLLAGPHCPVAHDIYRAGTEPTTYCSAHAPGLDLPEEETPTADEGW